MGGGWCSGCAFGLVGFLVLRFLRLVGLLIGGRYLAFGFWCCD